MVWDAATGRLVLTFKGHTHPVTAIAFSPDGKHLASCGYEGVVKLWDAENGREKLTLPGKPRNRTERSRNYVSLRTVGRPGFGRTSDEAYCPNVNIAYSPDGLWIGSLDEKGITMWDAQSARGVWRIGEIGEKDPFGKLFESLTFNPDGKQLAILNGFGTLKLCHAANGREIRVLENHDDERSWDNKIVRVAFSPDGRRLAVARRGGKVQVLETSTGKVLVDTKGHRSEAFSVAFGPDGKRIASAGGDGAVVWDATTGRRLLSIPGRPGSVLSVAYYADGSRFVTSGEDGTVRVFDAASFGELLTLRGHSNSVNCVALSPDSTRIASGGEDKTVKIWNSATGEEVLVFGGHAHPVSSVSFSPDGKRVASAAGGRTVMVWDAGTGKIIQIIGRVNKYPFNGVTFSPDGRLLVTSSYHSWIEGSPPVSVRVWDAATGRELCGIGLTEVAKAVFSPDGSLIATATASRYNSANFVNICRSYDGRWVRPIEGGTGALGARSRVNDVAFSPDGERLASAHGDGTVRISDAVTGLETLVLEGHTGAVLGVGFSPDGQQLLSASADGTVKVWDARRSDTESGR